MAFTMRQLCDEKTNLKSSAFYDNLADSIVSGAVELICTNYASKDSCAKNAPKIVDTFANLPIVKMPYSTTVSLIGVLKLLDSPMLFSF